MKNFGHENVLRFENYQDYLYSLASKNDLHYLPTQKAIQGVIKESCHRNFLPILRKEDFENLQQQQRTGPLSTQHMFSELVHSSDPVVSELLKREIPNQSKIISTIIFVLTRDTKGFEISGYIDYESSLRHYKSGMHSTRDWQRIFHENQRIIPNRNDLSFVNWKSGNVYRNETSNLVPVTRNLELYFRHKGDMSLIPAVQLNSRPTKYSSTLTFDSNVHGFVVLQDHIIRRKN